MVVFALGGLAAQEVGRGGRNCARRPRRAGGREGWSNKRWRQQPPLQGDFGHSEFRWNVIALHQNIFTRLAAPQKNSKPLLFKGGVGEDCLYQWRQQPTLQDQYGMAWGDARHCSRVSTKKRPTLCGLVLKRRLPTLPQLNAVPSALASLTSLFGMGRGGTSLL